MSRTVRALSAVLAVLFLINVLPSAFCQTFLAEDPRPDESYMIEDARGCYYLPVDDWFILYHLSENRDSLTVLGVLDGPEHTVH